MSIRVTQRNASAFLDLILFRSFDHLIVSRLIHSTADQSLVQERFILGRDARNLPASLARNGPSLAQ